MPPASLIPAKFSDQGTFLWEKCCNLYGIHIFHFLGPFEMAVVSQLKTQTWLITWELKPVVEPKLKFGSRSTTFTCQDVTYKMNFTKHLEHLQLDLQLIKGITINVLLFTKHN